MKKLLLPLLLLPLFAFFNACENDDDDNEVGVITLAFEAQYDGQQMEKYKNYDYNGFPLQFSRFHTYLSDVELLRAEGGSVRLSEIDFIEFTPDDAPNDVSAKVYRTIAGIPPGEYAGLRMGVGVKPSLNAKNPSDFDPGHPLYLESEYWSGWKSYIFTKIEGRGDQNNDGTQDLFVVHHYGSDPVYRTYTFNQPITVSASGNLPVSVIFDLKQIFTLENGSLYDLPANPQTSHNQANISIAEVIVENYGRAIHVEQ